MIPELCEKLSMEQSAEVWADTVLEKAKTKKPDSEYIKKIFEEKKLTIPAEIQMLTDIYSGKI